MMASCSAVPAFPLSARPVPARGLADAELAFRGALLESFEALEVCDRNLLWFHYFRGLDVDQLAAMRCSPRPAVLRQLARIRERMLRDARRGLAARLPADKRALDELLDLARDRFDAVIARMLRA